MKTVNCTHTAKQARTPKPISRDRLNEILRFLDSQTPHDPKNPLTKFHGYTMPQIGGTGPEVRPLALEQQQQGQARTPKPISRDRLNEILRFLDSQSPHDPNNPLTKFHGYTMPQIGGTRANVRPLAVEQQQQGQARTPKPISRDRHDQM